MDKYQDAWCSFFTRNVISARKIGNCEKVGSSTRENTMLVTNSLEEHRIEDKPPGESRMVLMLLKEVRSTCSRHASHSEIERQKIRQGYGLTESRGATAFFISDEQVKTHPAFCGRLVPTFSAEIVDYETGSAFPPGRKGELWLKSPPIINERALGK
ncbi:4-coumarate--CoA ligase [Salix suchowensis]|nr:4-coumarate--CoA ligase [Salix suchowensis]